MCLVKKYKWLKLVTAVYSTFLVIFSILLFYCVIVTSFVILIMLSYQQFLFSLVSSEKSQGRHVRAPFTLLAWAETFCNFLKHLSIIVNLFLGSKFNFLIGLNLQVM